jgi:2-polyprenyl-3-methyl-5-hydroxy-6-metoxy-1,4-benzoquinol methylase
MPTLTCVVCGEGRPHTVVSAVGERAYCRACFHGWRTQPPDYAYSSTAMCSLGTTPRRLETQIGFFAPFMPTNGSVLEIGCATGELAAAARASLPIQRYDAIELSPAGQTARARVDTLHTRPLRELLDNGGVGDRFDLVLMSHVLEHIEDPAAEIDAIRQVLKPDGALFLEVPNSSGNRRLPIDDNSSHLHFFSATSLTRLLANSGLETVAAATDVRLDARYADSLQVMARRFQIPRWSRTLLSDHPELADAKNLVVWGAGSLAEELLSNFFDPAKIDFFIDKNPAKLGGEVLGRPVRGPDALGRAPRTVLVNSIDFADAIVDDIGRLYPGVPHVLVRVGDLL